MSETAKPGDKPGNPWAFPLQATGPTGELWEPYWGMTLRDYFAGQALKWAGHGEWFNQDPEHAAIRAYRMADAMLAAREDKP